MGLKRFVKFFVASAVFLLSVPLSLMLYFVVLVNDVLANFMPKKLSLGSSYSPDTKNASIIILNWNGKELLEECLPSVIAAVEYDGNDHEIIVVDNGSTDESVHYIESHFPQVKVLALDKNYGFGEGNNRGVKAASNDIVVLLNNDMAVDRNFLSPLLKGFVGADVFAVSSQIFFQDKNRRREETGRTSALFKYGAFEYSHANVSEKLKNGYYPIYWAGGGSSAYDKNKFLALGGFDELFSPCYLEDTDISHVAWKHGWRVLFTPESKVYHKHRASSVKRFGEQYINILAEKNKYLFTWKNVTDLKFLISHFIFLPARVAYFSFKSKGFSAVRSFMLALRQFPKALVHRTKTTRRGTLQRAPTDKEILNISTDMLLYRERYLPKKKHEKGARLKILFVSAYLPHVGIHAGGGRMFKIIEILGRRHDITLISFLETEEENKYVPEIANHCVQVKTLLRRPTPKRNVVNIVPRVVEEFWSEGMHHLIKETMAETDFDIIQFEYTQMAQYGEKQVRGTCFSQSKRVFKILTEHEVTFINYHKLFAFQHGAFSKLGMLYEWMKTLKWEVDVCNKFDKVICMTNDDATELNNYLVDKKAEVLNTGVDASFFSQNTTAEEPDTLIFVGSFKHSPNVDGILYFSNEIFPLIKNSVPGVRLYIVGSNPPAEIKQLAHNPDVIVTGYVKDLRPYIEKSSVYVVPLRLGCGIRGKILEAWAMQKPVVATPLACAGIDAKNMDNIIISKTPEQFASDTIRLLKDPHLRKRLGKNARNVVEKKYDWGIIGKKMLEMYDSIL